VAGGRKIRVTVTAHQPTTTPATIPKNSIKIQAMENVQSSSTQFFTLTGMLGKQTTTRKQ